MPFDNIRSVVVRAPSASQVVDLGASRAAALNSQRVGGYPWMVDRAIRRHPSISPINLYTAAFTMALVGPAHVDHVTDVMRQWPLARIPNRLLAKVPSFTEPSYIAVEEFADLFSISVNGACPEQEIEARGFLIGFGKTALENALGSSSADGIIHHSFHCRIMSDEIIERLFPLQENRDVFYSLDACLDRGALRVSNEMTSEPESMIAQDVRMVDLIDAMQDSPFRVTRKPNLVPSSIRIWLHALNLTDFSTLADLQAALAAGRRSSETAYDGWSWPG